MRILVYSSAATFGGHELISLKGLDALLSAGHTLDVVCSNSNLELLRAVRMLEKSYLGQCNVHLRNYRTRSLQIARTWLSPLLAFKLYRMIQALDPDRILVLQGDIEQGSEIVVPAAIAGVTVVSYVPMVMSGAERSIKFAFVRDVLSSGIYKLVPRFIVIADYFRDQALKRGAKDVRVVPNCVDDAFISKPIRRSLMRKQLGISENEFISGFVGRISYQQKGIDRLIELLTCDIEYFCANRLLIVGAGKDLIRLKRDLKERGIADCVILCHWDNERVSYFDVMDVFLCASRFEGVPLTILEAMSRGVPVISTDLPGIVGMPIGLVSQKFRAQEMLSLLHKSKPRIVFDGEMPKPLLTGLTREGFDTSFVQAVVG